MTTPFSGKPTKDWPAASKTRWCTTPGPSHCWISVSSCKPYYRYWEQKAEITHEANPTSKVDPKGDPKIARNPEATPKGKAPENPKAGLDLTGKLGKHGKLTPQERQCHMDNSLCLFCGKTGHIAKECLKSTAIAARARAAVAELQESFLEEAKKD